MAEDLNKDIFAVLNAVDCSDFIEKKNDLSYLSWPNAWAEVKKKYPDANYVIWRDAEGRPWVGDSHLGYMVSTKMTIQGITHEMWLPVMDYNNNAMKDAKYTLHKGRKTYDVEPATMFDVNTAIMRCLVKNLAIFGLGLYIYAGEDLPEVESAEKPSTADSKPSTKPSTSKKKASTASMQSAEWQKVYDKIGEYAHSHGMTLKEIGRDYKVTLSSPIERLKEVYTDLTLSEPLSTADSNGEHEQEQAPNFAEINEQVPWK